ncbi:MAG: hypothetical protein R2747_05850 [Pyrinomonadaceae bacterium]
MQIIGTILIIMLGLAAIVNGQQDQMPVAGSNNLLCAGFVQRAGVDTGRKIVGADLEKEKNIYAQGDYVYLSQGSGSGVKVGDMFSVIRPRGRVETRWTDKKNLGFYVQEVGSLEVVRVRNDVSIAMVKTSCDNILMGDLFQPMPQRTSPVFKQRPPLDLFSTPSGKSSGRIFMARDGHEMVGPEQIVYIDLGAEDNVRVGDYLTIFRPLGTGSILDDLPGESVSARDEGYQSNEYRGGKFSNQAARKQGDEARGKVVTSKKAKRDRPGNLRKVLGEMVILNVKERTATAVIVRTAGEIHTGDFVEVQ